MTARDTSSLLSSGPNEIWVDIHYRYNGATYRYNLPLERGVKFLTGLKIDFAYRNIYRGRHFTVKMEPLGTIQLDSFELTGHLPYGEDLKYVFVNGYQSWTGSRERSPGERISSINWPGKLLSLDKAGDYRMHSYSEKKGEFHGYTYAYLRYSDRLLFAGSLDEEAGFTLIATNLRHNLFSVNKDVAGMRLDSERQMLDLVLLEGSENDVFDRYREMRGDTPRPGVRAAAWSSWHGYGQDIDEVKIRRNLAACRERKIPLRYFIVDDGWQPILGDWQVPGSGFPSGMSSLAAEIRGSGYIPGIWLAPFVVGGDSTVFRSRKEWLSRDRWNRIRPAGWNPDHGGTFYSLDLGRQDVRDYIAGTIRRFREEWGYGLVKLDLLYTAALFPPAGESRGVAMSRAMDFLVSLKGDLEYLAGGIPLESAFGRVEYCRIGADTTAYWENLFRRNIHSRERASTLSNLRSTVGRRQLNGRFFSNETDSFFLRSKKNSMEPHRRFTQFLLHTLLGSLITTSDDIGEYDDEEMRVYRSQFPMVTPQIDEVVESRRTVTIRYRAGGRSHISYSNLAERIRTFVLPEGHWFGAPGLKRRAHHLAGGRKQVLKPGESRNYMLLNPGDPFAGSDGHVFSGCEVSEILQADGNWQVIPAPGTLNDFRVWLRIPGESPLTINGSDAEFVRTPFGERLATAVIHC